MENIVEIGRRIKALREGKKLTQQALAEELHLKRETINMWENGLRDLKTAAIVALADYFKVSTDYLLGRTECKSRDIVVQAICEKTNLSNEAVDKLLNNRASPALHALDQLLQEDDFWLALDELDAAIEIAGSTTHNFHVRRLGDKSQVTLGGTYATDYYIQASWLDYWSAAQFVVYKKEGNNAET